MIAPNWHGLIPWCWNWSSRRGGLELFATGEEKKWNGEEDLHDISPVSFV
jgi:hypothetical protein